jgi:hypothetical protein
LPLALVQTSPGRQSTLVLQPPSGPDGVKKQPSGTRTAAVVVPPVVVVPEPVPLALVPLPLVDPDPPAVLVTSPLEELEPEFSRPPWDVPQALAVPMAKAQTQGSAPREMLAVGARRAMVI